ncbi:retrovirus-related pol polyprotein from transposon TNT 1-94, partial [Tanacetum coccineum]
VCGSLNHLIRDCDFHEKKMARKAELNYGRNNVQRVNKQNQFVPLAVPTRTGKIPVNTARTSGIKNVSTARQSFNRQAVLTSTAMKVNTVKPMVNTAKVKVVSTVGGKRETGTAVKPSRHMNGNKAYLAEFQDFNGGPVTFGGSKGYIIDKGFSDKPHNKTPYELLTGKIPIISYIRPFGCHVTILNTIDHLGKFAGKSDEGFLVGYSLQSKAFRVYNLETKRVEENLHITFLENKPNVAGKGPTWLFDLDYLTDSMNYHPVRSENQANLHAGQQEANQNAGTEDIIDAGDSEKEDESAQDCFVLPIWPSYSSTITPVLKTDDKREGPREEEQVFMDELERLKRQEKEANEEAEALRKKFAQEMELVSTASPHEGLSLSDPTNPKEDDSEIPPLEDIYQNSTDGIFTTSSYDDEGAVADSQTWKTVMNFRYRKFGLSRYAFMEEGLRDMRKRKGIDYDEVFAPVARIEANKDLFGLCLAYLGFLDLNILRKVYKVEMFSMGYIKLLEPVKFQMSSMGRAHFTFLDLSKLKQKEVVIFISQDKHMTGNKAYLAEFQDFNGGPVAFGGSKGYMYLTASRPNIMFAVCACSRVSSFDLESYSDSDYAGANLDRKYTTREYVAAASYCGQVLWIQNQMLDYGFNFMNTKIYIDNESTICIVKNPVYHSKTKHIAIRHHFIRDAYEKKLI